jgi:hypothetical protein
MVCFWGIFVGIYNLGFACRLYIGFVFGFFTIFTDEIKKEKFIRKKHQQLLSKISRI